MAAQSFDPAVAGKIEGDFNTWLREHKPGSEFDALCASPADLHRAFAADFSPGYLEEASKRGSGEFRAAVTATLELGRRILQGEFEPIKLSQSERLYVQPAAVELAALPSLPSVYQDPETRFARLTRFREAIEASRQLGAQDGNVLDLDRVPPGVEVIAVGDIHGRYENLRAILEYGNNWERIQRGEAVLVLLGDIVHEDYPAERRNLMSRSIQTQDFLMELKTLAPHGVHWIAGNHDYPNMPAVKGMSHQNHLLSQEFERKLGSEAEGARYLQELSDTMGLLPLMALTHHASLVHAGPISAPSLDHIRRAAIETSSGFFDEWSEDGKLSRQVWEHGRAGVPVQLQAVYTRYMSGELRYDGDDIEAFKAITGKHYLFVGHTPKRDDLDNFHWTVGGRDDHAVIYGANPRSGYLSIKSDALEYVPVIDRARTLADDDFSKLSGGSLSLRFEGRPFTLRVGKDVRLQIVEKDPYAPFIERTYIPDDRARDLEKADLLLVYDNGQKGSAHERVVIPLVPNGAPVAFGRTQAIFNGVAGIRADDQISRSHCSVSVGEKGSITLVDTSTNGTFYTEGAQYDYHGKPLVL